MEEGETSKEKASSSKKRKSVPGLEIEEIVKESSEMETDDSNDEDSWKDEELGNEEESGDNEPSHEIPILSECPGKDNSHLMEEVDLKDNKETEMNFEKEMNKDFEKDLTKDRDSED
ncbi:protein SQS1-like [Cryptomeria japonica]|uniref:protein SQS1-like n=1 Tax=Cryptomeria japonica TaxID=3369 RepID=UPI0027DA8A65|nr:protein SQS1-like [Cryptomeria japonica]